VIEHAHRAARHRMDRHKRGLVDQQHRLRSVAVRSTRLITTCDSLVGAYVIVGDLLDPTTSCSGNRTRHRGGDVHCLQSRKPAGSLSQLDSLVVRAMSGWQPQ
jgi:hypothetical protein